MTTDQPFADLRVADRLVLAAMRGEAEAHEALLNYGRDAAGLVEAAAAVHGSQALLDLAKRLVATPPQVETNLLSLREEAISRLVEEAKASAKNATDLGEITVPSGQVALFDPELIKVAVARRGRPRFDPGASAAGAIAWFGAEGAAKLVVSMATTPPPNGPLCMATLQVVSGVIFVGPPDASDGPRMGALRLHPFRTRLHERLDAGHFAKLKPGRYRVAAYESAPGTMRIHLASIDAQDAAPEPDMALLARVPRTFSP